MIKKEINFNNTEISCNYHVITEFTVKSHNNTAECRVKSYVTEQGIKDKKTAQNEVYINFTEKDYPFNEEYMKENNLNHRQVLELHLVKNHVNFKDGEII